MEYSFTFLKCLNKAKVHEVKMVNNKVSGSERRYFLQDQENQGIIRRGTIARRTINPAD